MRSNTTIFLAIALCAGLATGCGSDSGNGGGTTATTDTAGGTDTATGGTDTAGSSDTTGGGSDTSTGGTDTSTGGTDTSTGADSGGTDPNAGKCDSTDQLCLQSCVAAKCSKEYSACTTNPKCSGLLSCGAGCQQTPPVSPPAEVTGTTCIEKCSTLAGEDGVKALGTMQGCMAKNCIKSSYDPSKKCAQSDPNFQLCLQDCIFAECDAQYQACENDEGCGAITTCVGNCGSDQTCMQGCMSKAPAVSQQNFLGFLQCMQLSCLAQ